MRDVGLYVEIKRRLSDKEELEAITWRTKKRKEEPNNKFTKIMNKMFGEEWN